MKEAPKPKAKGKPTAKKEEPKEEEEEEEEEEEVPAENGDTKAEKVRIFLFASWNWLIVCTFNENK